MRWTSGFLEITEISLVKQLIQGIHSIVTVSCDSVSTHTKMRLQNVT